MFDAKSILNSVLRKYYFVVLSFLYFFLLTYWLRSGLPESKFVFNLVYAFLNSVILLSLIILIAKIPKASYILAFILTLIITADITHKLVYGTLLSIGGIASMFETNTAEAKGFLLLSVKEWLPAFILTLGVTILSTYKLSKNKISGLYVTCTLFIAFVMVVSSIMLSRSQEEREQGWEEFATAPELFIQTNISSRAPLGINAGIASFSYWNEMRKFKKEASSPKVLIDGLSLQNKEVAPQTIFLVIGESSLRTHYSLYGYDLPTTPFMDSLKLAKELLSYEALSVAPITREALRMTLSFASPLDQTPFFKNENIVTMSNQAGYDSYWISNQDKVGMHDSFIGLLASYAKMSKFYRFEKDDIELLDDVKSLFDPSKKQIFFVHLRGSHLDYRDKFDDIDVESLKVGNDRIDVIDYDRSIHHTDRVLSELNSFVLSLEKDSTASSIIVYYSDHGEIINKGHGIMGEGSEQFKIPFVIIPHNVKLDISQIMNSYIVDGIFNSNSITYVMSQVLGYTIDPQLEKKALNEAEYYYHVDGKKYKIKDLR